MKNVQCAMLAEILVQFNRAVKEMSCHQILKGIYKVAWRRRESRQLRQHEKHAELLRITYKYLDSPRIHNGVGSGRLTSKNSEGQGSLACCNSWGHKELSTT